MKIGINFCLWCGMLAFSEIKTAPSNWSLIRLFWLQFCTFLCTIEVEWLIYYFLPWTFKRSNPLPSSLHLLMDRTLGGTFCLLWGLSSPGRTCCSLGTHGSMQRNVAQYEKRSWKRCGKKNLRARNMSGQIMHIIWRISRNLSFPLSIRGQGCQIFI